MNPDVDEFRRFIKLLEADAPAEYTPWLFRVRKNEKAPARGLNWKNEENRLSPDEAIEWMEKGWNIGIAGTGSCPECDPAEDEADPNCEICEGDPQSTVDPLINVDIDDEDEIDIDDLKPTLIARSRSRTGVHGWYFADDDAEIPNISTPDAGEVRTRWQYVVAPGSYVPVEEKSELPASQRDSAGYYTVERADPVATLSDVEELPDVFQRKQTPTDAADVTPTVETMPGKNDVIQATEKAPDKSHTAESNSDLFEITTRDVIVKEGGSTNPGDRWNALFHGSDTGANMSFKNGLLHCWRHNCSHNGLQALVTLSEYSGNCEAVGAGHKNADAGPSCLKDENGAAIWHAWKYAKLNDYLPDGDPVPYAAIRHICLERDLCPVTELPDGQDESIPAYAWDAAISTIKNHDELNPGRSKIAGFDETTSEAGAATDGGAVASESQNPAESPAAPETKADTSALTPKNLRLEAGIGEDDSIGDLTDRQKAAFIWQLIKRNTDRHIRVLENDDLIAFDAEKGTWKGDGAGERELKHAARNALPLGEYGSNVYEQLVSQVEADFEVAMCRDELGLPAGQIAVQNGLLDLREAYENDGTAGLRGLQPTDYAVNRLQAKYDPHADCSEWKEFVGETVETKMIETVQEYLGTTLYKGHLAEKALLLVGSGANGKSTFLNTVKTALGEENISSVTPGNFRNRNSVATMENKIANIAAEISGQSMQGESLNAFKNLTGDDSTPAERKYQTPFSLNYTGGMIFATNEVPEAAHVSDGDRAFWRRWLIVQFDAVFPEGSDRRDPELGDRLQQEENLSAVLNWMIEGLGRFEDNGKEFSSSLTPEKTRSVWENWGDSLDYFLKNVAERDESAANISTGEAYQIYQHWCREENESTVSQMQFTKTAKTENFGYVGSGSSIRTERSQSPCLGYTAFGTTDAMADPLEVIEADTDVTTGLDSYDSSDREDTDESTDESADATGISDELKEEIKNAIRNDDSGDPVKLTQLRAVLPYHREKIIEAVSHLQNTNQIRDTRSGGYRLID